MSGSPEPLPFDFPDAERPVPPPLPSGWVEYLTRPTYAVSGPRAVPSSWADFAAASAPERDPEALARLLGDVPGADEPMDADMAEVVGYATLAWRMQREMHETLSAVTWRVLMLSTEGHSGATFALRQVVGAFLAENDRRARRGLPGVREQWQLDREIERAVFGGITKLGASAQVGGAA
ncbi:hypothetical protein FK529_09300 [Tsukamurella asaccharolytica]|uniref:Uncharacterized protein n=1 Tax=Tsukamurella asaccharolytica TaxID=2592067 RepID=A0A5C5R875_9ACTN|nr:hypothetical protein [Tsukamurella asaccharolytica]TWS19387.1 hypothetical protein FK529_09300 [Tsukamurella asaccharolytica]